MRKSYSLFIIAGILLCACMGGSRLSPEELNHKLDSIRKLEVREKLEAQGIRLEESTNPLKMFYDSLNVQPLPVAYSEDYINALPAFLPVPDEIVKYLDVEGFHPKAVSLPESLGARMILLAVDESGEEDEGKYSLWLYSLDDEYLPVDKLCLYAIEDEEDVYSIVPEEYIQYFSITSDYEIHLLDYSKKSNRTHTEEIYFLDPSRHFVMQKSEQNEVF